MFCYFIVVLLKHEDLIYNCLIGTLYMWGLLVLCEALGRLPFSVSGRHPHFVGPVGY